MNEEYTNEECEAALDELMEILKKMPKQYVTMLNMPRYTQAVESIEKIVALVKSDCPDAEVTVEYSELTGTTLCLRIIANEFNIYKIKDFCEAIESADTMAVIPRLDERLIIGFTYRDVRIPAPPVN